MHTDERLVPPLASNGLEQLAKILEIVDLTSGRRPAPTHVEAKAMAVLELASNDAGTTRLSVAELLRHQHRELLDSYAEAVGTDPDDVDAVVQLLLLYGFGRRHYPEHELLAVSGNHVVWYRAYGPWEVHAVVEDPETVDVDTHAGLAERVTSLGARYVITAPDAGGSLWWVPLVGWTSAIDEHAW